MTNQYRLLIDKFQQIQSAAEWLMVRYILLTMKDLAHGKVNALPRINILRVRSL